MEQTTSLRTKIYESSLKWRIENFLDYEACSIHELSSETIMFSETDAEWGLRIYPCIKKCYDPHNGEPLPKKFISFKLHIQDNESHTLAKRLFKVEIKIDPLGHQLMSPANRHLVKSKGFYAEPEFIEPIVKVFDYQEIKGEVVHEGKLIFCDEKFASYLDGGALAVFATAWIKTVEVHNVFEKTEKN